MDVQHPETLIKETIAYLIRRLDENTDAENFLRYSFNLKTDSNAWEFLKKQFIDSYHYKDRAGKTPNRIQNRGHESFPETMGTLHQNEFNNEPDTDWSPAANRRWAKAVRGRWKKSSSDPLEKIPLVVAVEVFSPVREEYLPENLV